MSDNRPTGHNKQEKLMRIFLPLGRAFSRTEKAMLLFKDIRWMSDVSNPTVEFQCQLTTENLDL